VGRCDLRQGMIGLEQIEFARKIAYKTMKTWPRSEHDDGLADAMIGLLLADRDYRPDGGASFQTFATYRIRGAVIDGFRRRYGRSTRIDLVSLEEDEIDLEGPDNTFDNLLIWAERQELAEAIATLPDRDRLILTLYFYEGMRLWEIGEVLGLTEGRISQKMKGIIKSLADHLQESMAA